MKATGIIVEYNPLHKGHAYHIEQTRLLTGADYVVAVMSGSFVQRGAPALLDKYTRTRMALLCGADIVLELPVLFAAGSAGDFAAGSMSLLNDLGVIDSLCFGSEAGDIRPFLKTAAVLNDEPEIFSARLQEGLRCGLSFPAARQKALNAVLPEFCDGFFSSPNNLLGLEYTTALLRKKSSVRPYTIPRKGAGYHDTLSASSKLHPESEKNAPPFSASGIRAALNMLDFNSFSETLCSAVPPQTLPLWESILSQNNYLFPDDLSSGLRYRLLTAAPGEFIRYADVTRELADKLEKNRYPVTGWEDLCTSLKTREITYSRISRALCRILLSITAEQLENARQNGHVSYARILGFRRSAAPLLSAIKKNSAIPLISKPADASRILSPNAMRMFEKDVLASHIWENALYQKKVCALAHTRAGRECCQATPAFCADANKKTAAHAPKSAAAVTNPVHEYIRQIIII